jgi:uncharacterized surface protein with fasciclin (FAS1) repeats
LCNANSRSGVICNGKDVRCTNDDRPLRTNITQGVNILRHLVFYHPKQLEQMMKMILTTGFVLASAFGFSQDKDIVDIAIGSEDHTTLVAAVKAADLVGTLQGKGPFTVFAPTNAAFDKLPKGTVEGLLKPESKEALSGILTYHVVAGNLDASAVVAAIKSGKGKAVLTTVNGAKLTASMKGDKVILTDSKGGTSTVTATDLKGSNGVVHVIDTVVMP